MNYKFYYVAVYRNKNNKQPLQCYGSHETLEGAKRDSIDRAKYYNQSTSIYGVTGANEIILINSVKV